VRFRACGADRHRNGSPPGGGSLPGTWKSAEAVTSISTLPGPADPATEPLPRRHAGSPAPVPPGRLVLGRYRLEQRLGTGGFGAVWLALDERLDRRVAVKAVPRPPGEEEHAGRSQREAVAAARLNHPGIVTLYEAGADADGHYLISELVEGATLSQLMASGGLSDRDVTRIGIALAGALVHAHSRGVIHRDVKPQNVMVPARPQDDAGVAKLTDFGIALLAGDEPLTRTGDVVGTLAYMAPEQAEGRRVGPEADLYALSLVLYEALAGSHPVRGAGPAATARRLGAVLPSLGRSRRDLPAPMVDAIDRGVRPAPEERGSLTHLRAALENAVEEVSDEGGRLPTVARRPLPHLRGAGRIAAGLGAGALVAGASALGPTPPVDPLAAAAVAAIAVVFLPRLGWLAAAAAVTGWLALGKSAEPGTALVVGAALAATPFLLARAGRLWSVHALAPLLGAVALAGAFPALAGQARTAWRRAALGALGGWSLVLVETLAQRRLFLGPPDGAWAPERWAASLSDALLHAVVPALTGGTLLCAPLWALAALVLPWLVRGRSLVADAAAASLWGVALAAGGSAIAGVVEGSGAVADPRGGIAGAAVGALLAVALRAARGPSPRALRGAPPPVVPGGGAAVPNH